MIRRWRRCIVFDPDKPAIAIYHLSEPGEWCNFQKVFYIISSPEKRRIYSKQRAADLWLAQLPFDPENLFFYDTGTTTSEYKIWEDLESFDWRKFENIQVYKLHIPRIRSKFRKVGRWFLGGRIEVYVVRNPPATDAHQWTTLSEEVRPVMEGPVMEEPTSGPSRTMQQLKYAEGRMPLTVSNGKETQLLAPRKIPSSSVQLQI